MFLVLKVHAAALASWLVAALEVHCGRITFMIWGGLVLFRIGLLWQRVDWLVLGT